MKKRFIKKVTKYQSLYSIPLLLLFLVYPFLTKYNIVNNPLLNDPSYYQTETLADIFLYIKMEFLLFIPLLMLCVFVSDFVMNCCTHNLIASEYKKFIPLGIYAVWIILSTVFAQNHKAALNGIPGQFESMWILLTYLAICIFAYWYIRTVEKKTLLLYTILGGSLLMGTLFLLQFLDADPYIALFSQYNASVAIDGVYGGFFNPNYLGSYVCLMLPILITLFVAFRKQITLALLFGISIFLTVLGLIGSKTTGGFIAILLLIGFVIIFFIFRTFHLSAKKFFVTLGIILSLGIACIIAIFPSMERSNRYLYELLNAVYTNEDCIEIHYNDSILYLRTEHNDTTFQIYCTDKNGNEVKTRTDGNTFFFVDEKYAHFSITPYLLTESDNCIAFEFKYDDTSWFFTNDLGDNSYYYITSSGGFTKSTPENTSLGVIFSSTPKLLSGRGYIWSQSIPLLTDTLLIGYGPDNFATQFPNHNFWGALRGGFNNTYISKPHSMYLQMALQTGLPSLLAFLVFYLIYFVKSVKLYLSAGFHSELEFTGFGIFLGTIGYCIIGLINDSSLTVAPFFWLLIGIGYGLNHYIHTQKEAVVK